jgi:hypothetical protein
VASAVALRLSASSQLASAVAKRLKVGQASSDSIASAVIRRLGGQQQGADLAVNSENLGDEPGAESGE